MLSASTVLAQGKTEQITDGVYAFNLGDQELPYTSMFVVTGDGVMVVDPIKSESARAMLQEIRKVTMNPSAMSSTVMTTGTTLLADKFSRTTEQRSSLIPMLTNGSSHTQALIRYLQTVLGVGVKRSTAWVDSLWNSVSLARATAME